MLLSNQRIRLGIDTSKMDAPTDVITGNSPQFWNAVDLQFELAFFYGANLLSLTNYDSITVQVKQGDPRTGLPLMAQTISSGSINNALSLNAWLGGNPTDCHALIVFPNAQTNLNLTDDTDTFWLVISGLTSDSPAHEIIFGACPISVTEAGYSTYPPASVVSPTYYTAAQSDARYLLAVDLTTINSEISTLNTEMTSVTTTANAALPKAGGTVTGAITLTGISGVLKAPGGIITGSATTTDLPEGSNLYYTSARFTAALAAVTNVASGVCPLDASALVPAANLPHAAIRQTFTVSSQSAMLALGALQGDLAIRTDLNACFVLTANPASTLGNWAQLLAPAGTVSSVNTLTGAVVLTTTNIAEGTNLYYTTARTHTDALTAVLTGFSNATGGNVTAGDDILVALGRLENRCALNDAKVSASGYVKADGTVAMTGNLGFSGTSIAGVVLNNLTDAQRAALTPSNGMIIYDTTLAQVMIYNGAWVSLASSGGTGTAWLNGSGAPSSGLGANGNYYLDTSTGNVYLKSSGTWSIIYSPTASPLTTGTGPAPTITVQSHAGTSATADKTDDTNPTQSAFRVKLVVGASSSSGAYFTVAFGSTFAFKPKVVWSVNTTGYDGGFFVDLSTLTTTGFTFSAFVSMPAGTYDIDFVVLG